MFADNRQRLEEIQKRLTEEAAQTIEQLRKLDDQRREREAQAAKNAGGMSARHTEENDAREKSAKQERDDLSRKLDAEAKAFQRRADDFAKMQEQEREAFSMKSGLAKALGGNAFANKQADEKAAFAKKEFEDKRAFEERKFAETKALNDKLAYEKKAMLDKQALERQQLEKLRAEQKAASDRIIAFEKQTAEHLQAEKARQEQQQKQTQGQSSAAPKAADDPNSKYSVGMGRGESHGAAWAAAATHAMERARDHAATQAELADRAKDLQRQADDAAKLRDSLGAVDRDGLVVKGTSEDTLRKYAEADHDARSALNQKKLTDLKAELDAKQYEHSLGVDIANKENLIRGNSSDYKQYTKEADIANQQADSLKAEIEKVQKQQDNLAKTRQEFIDQTVARHGEGDAATQKVAADLTSDRIKQDQASQKIGAELTADRIQREQADDAANQQETAKAPAETAAPDADAARKPRWDQQGGGVDKLSPEQTAAAQEAFGRKMKESPDHKYKDDFGGYVDDVQKRMQPSEKSWSEKEGGWNKLSKADKQAAGAEHATWQMQGEDRSQVPLAQYVADRQRQAAADRQLQAEAAKPEVTKVDAAKPEAPKPDATKPEAQKPEQKPVGQHDWKLQSGGYSGLSPEHEANAFKDYGKYLERNQDNAKPYKDFIQGEQDKMAAMPKDATNTQSVQAWSQQYGDISRLQRSTDAGKQEQLKAKLEEAAARERQQGQHAADRGDKVKAKAHSDAANSCEKAVNGDYEAARKERSGAMEAINRKASENPHGRGDSPPHRHSDGEGEKEGDSQPKLTPVNHPDDDNQPRFRMK